MTRSRIFEEYARIADEQGLISDPVERVKTAKSKTEEYFDEFSTRPSYKPREFSSSELLYGVDPNGKQKHIMEQAHPEPVVLSPAYDKINGLVENNIERQNIIVNQLLEPNDGNINYKKLAEQDLVYELIRIANHLDIKGEEQLRALADDCIEKLAIDKEAGLWDDAKSWVKEKLGPQYSNIVSDVEGVGTGVAAGTGIGALVGGVLGGVFGVGAGAIPGATAGAYAGAAIGGIISSLGKTGPHATSVSVNSQKAMDEVKDLLKKFPEDRLLPKLQNNLILLKKSAENYASMLNSSPDSVTNQKSEENTKKYIDQMETVKFDIKEFNAHCNAGAYKEDYYKVTELFYWFIDTDEDDVKKALDVLHEVIEKAEEGIKKLKEEAQKAIEKAKSTPTTPSSKPEVKKEESKKEAPKDNQTPSSIPDDQETAFQN